MAEAVYPTRETRIVGINPVGPEQRGIYYTPGYYRPVSRYMEAPFQPHLQVGRNTAQRKVANYFQFLDDDTVVESDEDESPKKRRERHRRRTGLLNRIFALVFCVSELLLGAALIAFGSARISVYRNEITYVTGPPTSNATDAVATATVVLADGVFIITASLIGIAAFALNRRGLKMSHMIFAAISLILLLVAVVATSHEVSNLRLSGSSSNQQFGLNIALLTLISVVLLILLQTTIVQSAYGLVPGRLRIRSWPISHLIVALITAIFATILIATSAVGIHQALRITTTLPGLLVLKLVKRDVCVISMVVGLFIWQINFWAIGAVFTRSRPLSLAASVLYIPGAFVLVASALSAFTRLIPSLHVVNPNGHGPDSSTIYYLIFGTEIILGISLFVTMAVVAVSIFKK